VGIIPETQAWGAQRLRTRLVLPSTARARPEMAMKSVAPPFEPAGMAAAVPSLAREVRVASRLTGAQAAGIVRDNAAVPLEQFELMERMRLRLQELREKELKLLRQKLELAKQRKKMVQELLRRQFLQEKKMLQAQKAERNLPAPVAWGLAGTRAARNHQPLDHAATAEVDYQQEVAELDYMLEVLKEYQQNAVAPEYEWKRKPLPAPPAIVAVASAEGDQENVSPSSPPVQGYSAEEVSESIPMRSGLPAEIKAEAAVPSTF